MTASDWGPDSPADAVSKADVVARLAGQHAETVPSVSAPARTPVPEDTEERDGRKALSDDLRRQLAAIIAHPKMPAADRRYFAGGGCDRCPKALDAADAVIEAGFRLVSDDEATVDRLAAVLWTRLNPRGRAWSELLGGPSEVEFREHARAAVRALREAGQ